jgi:hypothetical protein
MPWIARVRALFRRKELTKELDEELEFHLAMRNELNIKQGMPIAEAQRAARLRFGNPSLWRERISEIDLMRLLQTVLQDLRYGIRMLVRNSGFTIVAVLALALGIGVNTATFTANKAFFGLSLDASNPGNMVNLALLLHSGATTPYFSYSDYQAYRDGLHSFSGVVAIRPGIEELTISGVEGICKTAKLRNRITCGEVRASPGQRQRCSISQYRRSLRKLFLGPQKIVFQRSSTRFAPNSTYRSSSPEYARPSVQ